MCEQLWEKVENKVVVPGERNTFAGFEYHALHCIIEKFKKKVLKIWGTIVLLLCPWRTALTDHIAQIDKG